MVSASEHVLCLSMLLLLGTCNKVSAGVRCLCMDLKSGFFACQDAKVLMHVADQTYMHSVYSRLCNMECSVQCISSIVAV